jgi:hypothetical protein
MALATFAWSLPAFAQDGDEPKAQEKGEKDEKDKEKEAKELEAKVREILVSFEGQNRYSSDEPRVTRIIAMGRPAIPVLMRYLREVNAGRMPSGGFHQEAARDALKGLVGEQDFADLAELLADGVLEASRALASLENPKVLDALLVPIRKGLVSWEYVEDLQRFGKVKEVRAAFVEWLDKFGRAGEWQGATVARAVGELGIVEAIPVMKEIVASKKCDSYPRVEMAEALTRMGEKAGVAVLLDEFDPSTEGLGRIHGHRHQVGEALNRVVGEKWYIGRHGPGEDEGNFDEAVPKFKEWWKKAEATLRWDEKKLKWVW